MNQPKPQPIQIRASDSDLKGVYANVMKVGHTQEEFILEFFNIIDKTGILSARIFVSPGHFKRIVQALEDNLKKYEERFGIISPSEAPAQDIGFKP